MQYPKMAFQSLIELKIVLFMYEEVGIDPNLV